MPADADPSDAGPSDAGPSDAGPSDAGRADAVVATPFALDLVLADGRRLDLRVAELGLACCAVELVAAAVRGTGGFGPAGGTVASGSTGASGGTGASGSTGTSGSTAASGSDLHVLVVSGTVTDKVAPALRRLLDALPEPRRVVSFGACANCGGPYWDSYSVTKGVDQVLPVDVWVPGCPPRPEALVHGLQRLQDVAPAAARPLTAPLVRPAADVRPDDLQGPLT